MGTTLTTTTSIPQDEALEAWRAMSPAEVAASHIRREMELDLAAAVHGELYFS